jgi:hypothetical protein
MPFPLGFAIEDQEDTRRESGDAVIFSLFTAFFIFDNLVDLITHFIGNIVIF